MDKKRATYSELALLFITLIWGLGFPITKLAVNNGFGPNTIMVGRFLTAAILLGIVYNKKLKKINKQVIIFGSITGVFLFLGFFFQTMGSVYTTASKNGFITQLNIIFVPFIYFVFIRKRLTIYNIISVIIAIVGLFILMYNPNDFTRVNIGDFYTFICAIMVAFNVVTGSYFQKKYDFDPATFVFVNIVIAAVFSVLAMLLFEDFPTLPIMAYWPLLFLGVLNTALGFLVQSYALKYSEPTKVSLIVTLESVFAAFGAVILLNEDITASIITGGLLIVTGVIVSETKLFNNRNEEKQ